MEERSKKVFYYKLPNGKVPFFEWLENLEDRLGRSRIRRRLERMELGYYGDYKLLGSGICEARFFLGPGYRIYFARPDQKSIVFLCGGDKSSQEKDIILGKHYWNYCRGLI